MRKEKVDKNFLFRLSFMKDPVRILFDDSGEGIFTVVPGSLDYPGRGVVTLDLKDQDGTIYRASRYFHSERQGFSEGESDWYYLVFYEL